MYTIRKQFSFSAAHHLEHLPEGHPCKRQHGHNYIVELVLRSEGINEDSFVTDYRELNTFKDYLDCNLDHRDLNEILKFRTTAENLANHFFYLCQVWYPNLYMVRVSETPKTWAEYSDGV